jgi:hypothetical protein
MSTAADIEAAYSGATPMNSNALGYWMLPVSHGSLPLRIHLDFTNKRQDSARFKFNEYIGNADIRGPWLVWNGFFPMQYVLRVDKNKSGANEVRIEHIAAEQRIEAINTVYAQSGDFSSVADNGTVSLSIESVTVDNIPGLFRTSGRIYFRVYLDGQRVPDQQLLIPGVPFPLESERQAWLPIREGTEEHFATYRANIATLLQPSESTTGSMIPKGAVTIEVFSEGGSSLGFVPLKSALEANGRATKVSSGRTPGVVLTLSIVPPTSQVPSFESIRPLLNKMNYYVVNPPNDGIFVGGLITQDKRGSSFYGVPSGVAAPVSMPTSAALIADETQRLSLREVLAGFWSLDRWQGAQPANRGANRYDQSRSIFQRP